MKKATCLTDDQRWQSVLARDPNADGEFVFAVRTTGIFCRPSCRARHALRENVSFYANASEALAAANVVSQKKPMPSNIGWIKSPTRVDCWNRKRL
ncbi:regulatory protein of adaptative response [Escherichia coli]|nr:regulatory protein of adaptative response [Escherichia coli]